MTCIAAENERQSFEPHRSVLLLAMTIWLGACGEGNDATSQRTGGDTAAAGGASITGATTATGSTSATLSTSASGSTSMNGGAAASGGATQSGSDRPSGRGGTTGYSEPSRPAQETSKGVASSDCVSPFQNTQLLTSADAPRCDCEDGTAICVDGVQFVCKTTWKGVSVGTCAGPNACLNLDGTTFKSAETQTCMSGGGDYQCIWNLEFTLGLRANYVIRRGAGGNQEGEYHCDGVSVIIRTGSTDTTATYDEDARTITINGVKYITAS